MAAKLCNPKGEMVAGDKVEIKLTSEFLEKLLERLEAEAKNRELSAAMADSRTDGGAFQLRAEVRAFQAGREGSIPDSWRTIAQQLANELDPEYAEHQRLSEKFS